MSLPLTPLIIDNRGDAPQPGIHALIIGVSRYPALEPVGAPVSLTLGLKTLEGPAASAYRIAEALLTRQAEFVVPLTTVRLLIAPSEHELAVVDGLRGATKHHPNAGPSNSATSENVLKALGDWRRDAESHRSNIAFFYFAGHGLGHSGTETALLCQDFGDGIGGKLHRAVDRQNILGGMRGSYRYAPIASEQYFYFDCCRDLPPGLANSTPLPTEAFTLDKEPRNECVQAQFSAAAVGGTAQAVPIGDPHPRTVFGAALRESLLRGGDLIRVGNDSRWCLTAEGIHKGMKAYANASLDLAGYSKLWRPEGYDPPGPILLHLATRPFVELSFQIEPSEDHDVAQIQYGEYQGIPGEPVGPPVPRGPVDNVLAGTYKVWKACRGGALLELESPVLVAHVCARVFLRCDQCRA